MQHYLDYVPLLFMVIVPAIQYYKNRMLLNVYITLYIIVIIITTLFPLTIYRASLIVTENIIHIEYILHVQYILRIYIYIEYVHRIYSAYMRLQN